MSWQERLPDGLSNIETTDEGFQASLSLPVDEDGFFGRECPTCEQPFKMNADQWEALPDEAEVTCPYCGEQPEDVNDFMTPDQRERVDAAINALAEQYVHGAFSDMFRESFGSRPRRTGGGMFSIEMSVDTGSPHPIRVLPEYVEEKVRRTITCSNCSTISAVYGASAFCPVCGPRAALATVIEAIEAARTALSLEDVLPEDAREQARAAGVFGNVAADTIKRVVTLFEVFARNQFEERVEAHVDALRKAGRGVFQRLDDAGDLFDEHSGLRLSALVDADTWTRLLVTFQQRHVLVHRHGQIDDQYLQRVPTARQRVGQALVVTRKEAEQALDDLERLVQALALA
ncbi:hypothetical protein BH18ACT12_BH18ACT12_23890 [soil metagenome]